jgi:hypothetical protein
MKKDYRALSGGGKECDFRELQAERWMGKGEMRVPGVVLATGRQKVNKYPSCHTMCQGVPTSDFA